MEPYTGQLKEYKWKIEKTTSHRRGSDGSYETHYYCNDILTFDIETTSSFMLDDGTIIPYEKGRDPEYWNSLEAMALCYIWQFSVNDIVYYGRELTSFASLLDDLPEEVYFIIWVHNLAFEFQFLLNIMEFKNIFARSPHKPMKAIPKRWPCIEFRCTYMLTRLSLESWGKQLGMPKLVGSLDYDIIRTPLTPLTPEEMAYCERDCIVVYTGIKKYLEKYYRVRKIPLTQTGTVRQEVKRILQLKEGYNAFIKKLVPATVEEYKRLQLIFAGGYTHANKYYSGKVVRGLIQHLDYTSSYPSVMVCEKYPMTPWAYTGKKVIPDESTFADYAYILELKFYNIRSTSYNTYVQAAKVQESKACRFDNGRVLCADYLKLTMTEQDYLTIKENYTWDDMEVIHVWKSRKEYLPKEFIEYVLDLYHNKTTLKNVAGMEDLYQQSKQYINSMFGMMVTAIMQANVIFEDGEWHIEPITAEAVRMKLDKLRNYKPSEKRYFLSYSWGCYVTAYARRNLWRCIKYCDNKVIYADTDSLFINGFVNFSWYNKEVTEKLRAACKALDLDFEKTRPKDPDGIPRPLGVFSNEPNCIEFLTLGAKRYVERREDGKLYLTVSGINKEAMALLNDNIENFKDGFNFDKDAECVDKKLSTYRDLMPEATYPDGYHSTYKHGINLRRTGYLLSLTDEYKCLIDYQDGDLVLSEAFINHLRGKF